MEDNSGHTMSELAGKAEISLADMLIPLYDNMLEGRMKHHQGER
jgi:hypothetical protein